MKTFILTLGLITFGFKGLAQGFLSFPDSNANWITGHATWDPAGPPPDNPVFSPESFCTNGQDSIIDGMNYIVLTDCSGGIEGFIRDSSGTQYFIEVGTTTEYTLCDFNAEEGDTLYNTYPSGYAPYFIVGEKWTEDVYGVSRRFVTIGEGTWIEGIGYSDGLLTPQVASVSGGKSISMCMSYNDTIWSNQADLVNVAGTCANFLSVSTPKKAQKFEVYPNPSAGLFTISLVGDIDDFNEIVVRNSIGEIIRTLTINVNQNIQLDLSDYANGIYYVNATNNSETAQVKLVKM